MKIKELMIHKNNMDKLCVSWNISDGDQSSYELFLIKEGSIVERVKTSGAVMKCSLRTLIEPMREYALLLTVKSGELLSCARAGFFSGKSELSQSVSY